MMKQLQKDNRGASLIIIVAILALFLVLACNVLMAAQATTTGLDEEYEVQRVNMYVSSVHNCISEKIQSGEIRGIFSDGQTHNVTLDGFEGGQVTLEATKLSGKMDAEVIFTIPFEGKNYKISTVYLVNNGTITLKSCSGILSDE